MSGEGTPSEVSPIQQILGEQIWEMFGTPEVFAFLVGAGVIEIDGEKLRGVTTMMAEAGTPDARKAIVAAAHVEATTLPGPVLRLEFKGYERPEGWLSKTDEVALGAIAEGHTLDEDCPVCAKESGAPTEVENGTLPGADFDA